MSSSLNILRICFIACHGAPADHFLNFAQSLIMQGHVVEIYATGAALDKLQNATVPNLIPFSLDKGKEEQTAQKIAKKCMNAAVVITDLGHPFDETIQKALKQHAPNVIRYTYYDNPEPFVPGGYSKTASKVIQLAQKVLFANSNFTHGQIYEDPDKQIEIPFENRIGLGYYPIDQAERIAKKRASSQQQFREQFFSKHSLKDLGQKILVYAGGNNDEYFSKAFPAFLRILDEAVQHTDLSNLIILLQQHPGAKGSNFDAHLMKKWIDQQNQRKNAPQLILSELNSGDAQVMADTMLYYQTSMGPQFVLAGIPTIQVGHQVYEDILVKNRLCLTATNAEQLLNAFTHLQTNQVTVLNHEVISRGLGICSDWAVRLTRELTLNHDANLTSPFTHPGNPLLQMRAQEVPIKDILSDEIQSVVDQMFKIAKGERTDPEQRSMVGLAAPQIGICKRIILIDEGIDDTKKEFGKLTAYINPEILWHSDEMVDGIEGCYSVDSRVVGIVPRATTIRIRAFDRHGNPVIKEFLGFTARIFQHELDHLDGIRFPDRVAQKEKIHWVEATEYEDYRKNWKSWDRICPWDIWLKMKESLLKRG